MLLPRKTYDFGAASAGRDIKLQDGVIPQMNGLVYPDCVIRNNFEQSSEFLAR